MANIYGSQQVLKGAFKADLARALVNGQSAGLLLQNLQFNFAQAVSTLYELGSSDVYYVIGRAQGTAGISRVVGPSQLNLAFLERFGDGCRAPTNQITVGAKAGCTNNLGGGTYRLDGCLITSMGASMGAQDMLINEQIQMQFINLDIS